MASDIHCQPNIGPEPFGITFIEALYAGLPVVSTQIGGAVEIITHSCGVLVPPDDPVALAEALAGLIKDPDVRSQLGAAGPERARQLCEPVKILGQLQDVLANVTHKQLVSL
jgi:glycosyltransferase involved in cell wall biosynthesis